MLRDDAIALWLWYRREVLISRCMEVKHGFYYWPATASDRGYVRRIADYLDVEPLGTSHTSGLDKNHAYVDALDRNTRIRYEIALSGTSMELDADKYFTIRGCMGNALKRIPGLWEETRAFRHAWERIRSMPAHYAEARRAYRECMIDHSGVDLDHPDAAETFVAAENAPAIREAVTVALDQCGATWSRAYRSAEHQLAERFLNWRNREPLEALRRRYLGVEKTIKRDVDIVDHLRREGAPSKEGPGS